MLPSCRLGFRIDSEGERWLNVSQKICSEGGTEPWCFLTTGGSRGGCVHCSERHCWSTAIVNALPNRKLDLSKCTTFSTGQIALRMPRTLVVAYFKAEGVCWCFRIRANERHRSQSVHGTRIRLVVSVGDVSNCPLANRNPLTAETDQSLQLRICIAWSCTFLVGFQYFSYNKIRMGDFTPPSNKHLGKNDFSVECFIP